VELNSLRRAIDDFRVIQSALCARLRELTTHYDTASQRIHELEGRSKAARQMIQTREQQLEAMRHAILDAARIGSDLPER
jgi:chromosome segregation ATPase